MTEHPNTRPGVWQACPVCHGQGFLNKPPWVAGDQHSWLASNTQTYTCQACNGGGMVERPAAPHDSSGAAPRPYPERKPQ